MAGYHAVSTVAGQIDMFVIDFFSLAHQELCSRLAYAMACCPSSVQR